jgi:type VI secretion system secreted protein VgrG
MTAKFNTSDETLKPEGPAEQSQSGEFRTWLFLTTPIDGAQRKFLLQELAGEEAIFGLFKYRLTLKTREKDIVFSSILNKSVTIHIVQRNGTTRFINGVVTFLSQAEFDGIITTYYAEIRPWLWKLTLTQNSRIFQQENVPDIIKTVFKDLGFTDFEDKTKGTFKKREYCVQYQESSFNFVSRLMEEEGIFYFFEHTEDKHILVLADDPDAHQPCPGLDAARVRGFDPEDDGLIEKCALEQRLIPNTFATSDFSFEAPTTNLFTSVNTQDSGKLLVYDFPGRYATTADGEKIANKRIEAIEMLKKNLKGEGYCRSFITGYKFKLADHYRTDINGFYLLHRLEIKANQTAYRNTFEAIPFETPFRPAVLKRKPRIYGSQTAVVTGKQGEEIWPDKYGRVKVQFHWDQDGKKDEKSSCWIRVSQMWAGKGWGSMFIPRVGTEVIVNFLEGDPDQPIITGMVYNARQSVPFGLPDNKNKCIIRSRSSKEGQAGNELCFDDTKDAEIFEIHAQKDHKIKVENDRDTQVLNDDKLTITKNRSVSILENDDKLVVQQGNREVTIATGNETHNNKGNYNQEVSGNYTLNVSGNMTIKAAGNVTINGALIKLN